MCNIKDVESLHVLIKELIKYKDLVKCPICLDVMRNAVQVGCSHSFCTECLSTFIDVNTTKPVQCPLCRKVIRCQRKAPNHRLEHLSKFVLGVSAKLKNIFGCEISELDSICKINCILDTLQGKKLNVDENSTSSRQNTESTDIVPGTVFEQPPEPSRNVKKATIKQENVKRKGRCAGKQPVAKQDAFDLLKESAKHNQFKNIKTYSRKKLTDKRPEIYDKLLDFEDDVTKKKIILWLNDSRNNFERSTQTQQETFDSSPQSFNMPSISQEDVYVRHYDDSFMSDVKRNRIDFINKGKHVRKARSLDVEIRTYSGRPCVKRHSLACETPEFEDINIEEINSESNMYVANIVQLMEDEYLKTMESEIPLVDAPHLMKGPESKHCKLKESNKKDLENNKKRKVNEDIQGGKSVKGDTGWSRIKKIKKSIKKNERKPKKLRISYTPASSSGRNTAGVSRKKHTAQQPVVTLHQLRFNNEGQVIKASGQTKKKCERNDVSNKNVETNDVPNKSCKANDIPKHKVFNLDDIELYIGENILKCVDIPEDQSICKSGAENDTDRIKESVSSTKTISEYVEHSALKCNDSNNILVKGDGNNAKSVLAKGGEAVQENMFHIENIPVSLKQKVPIPVSLKQKVPMLNDLSEVLAKGESATVQKKSPPHRKISLSLNDSNKLQNVSQMKRIPLSLGQSVSISNHNENLVAKEKSFAIENTRQWLEQNAKSELNEPTSCDEVKVDGGADLNNTENLNQKQKESNFIPANFDADFFMQPTQVIIPRNQITGDDIEQQLKVIFSSPNESNSNLSNKSQKNRSKQDLSEIEGDLNKSKQNFSIPEHDLSKSEQDLSMSEQNLSKSEQDLNKLKQGINKSSQHVNKSEQVDNSKQDLNSVPVLKKPERELNKSDEDLNKSKQYLNKFGLDLNNSVQDLNQFEHNLQTDFSKDLTSREAAQNNNLQEKITLGRDILNDFDEVIAKYINELQYNNGNERQNSELMPHFQKLQTYVSTMKTLLKDMHNAKDSSSNSVPLLPETADIFHSTPKLSTLELQEPKTIFNSTTQTASLDLVSIGIQTDDVRSPGFRISSTESFKTQIRCHVQMQTDPHLCPKCRYVFKTNEDVVSQKSPSKILVYDRDFIRHLAEKYEFTQSLDNIQFNTQDVVGIGDKRKSQQTQSTAVHISDGQQNEMKASKHLRLQNISAKSQTHSRENLIPSQNESQVNAVNRYEFTQSLDNIEFNTCDVINNAVGKKRQEQSLREETLAIESIKLPKPQVPHNDSVGAENIRLSNPQIEHLTKSQTFNPLKSSLESNLILSVGYPMQDQKTKQVNRKLDFLNISKKYKRIRAPASDSDSDDGNPKKVKKLENKYMRNDLTVQFLSEQEAEVPTVKHNQQSESFFLPTGGSDNINYDEYLEKIVRKYDNEIISSTPKQATSKVVSPKLFSAEKRTAMQEIISKCDALIRQVTSKNIEVFQNVSDKNRTVKNSEAMDCTVPEEFAVSFNQDVSRKISQKHGQAKVKQVENFSESLFGNTVLENKLESSNLPENNLSLNVVDEFKNHFDDSFENKVDPNGEIVGEDNLQDIITNNCNEKVKDNQGDKVIILQNILLANKHVTNITSKLQYNLEEEMAKLEENNEIKSIISEEIFTSESEDVDVVETTPQKHSPIRALSQSYQKWKEQKISPQMSLRGSPDVSSVNPEVPFCFDEALPPPLEFQDFDEVNDENDKNHLSGLAGVTSLDLDLTLVPNMPYKNDVNITRKGELSGSDSVAKRPLSLLNTNIMIESSTPTSSSQKSLALSPIRPEQKILNPLEIAHNSRFLPLDLVTVKSPPPRLVITSTPKQQSILNYVRTSQSSRKDFNVSDSSLVSVKPMQEAPVVNSKPCIACTRLNKDQVIAISSLTNKKLATYSTSFSSRVTHMIVLVNEKNCIIDHTIKFVSAVAAGIWVLNFSWIQECLAQNRIVKEEPYEALDVSGIAGPRLARLTRLENPLFKGYIIHAAPPFVSTTQKDMELVVTMLGGQIVPLPDCLLEKDGVRIIITEARATQDFELYESWLETLHVVTVDIEWLSRSVGQYQLLSLRPFALCSDDNISELGYPPEILVHTPFSFTQSMYTT